MFRAAYSVTHKIVGCISVLLLFLGVLDITLRAFDVTPSWRNTTESIGDRINPIDDVSASDPTPEATNPPTAVPPTSVPEEANEPTTTAINNTPTPGPTEPPETPEPDTRSELEPTPTIEEISWGEGKYWDVGGGNDPTVSGFSATKTGRGNPDCSINSLTDRSFKSITQESIATIEIPVDPQLYTFLTFCVRDPNGEIDLVISFNEPILESEDCNNSRRWSIPENNGEYRRLTTQLNSRCITSSSLSFNMERTSEGELQLFGLYVHQGTLLGQQSPTIAPVSNTSTAADGTYFDLGVEDATTIQEFHPAVESASVCELGGSQDRSVRAPVQRNSPPWPTVILPVEPGKDAHIKFCHVALKQDSYFQIWLGGSRPENRACAGTEMYIHSYLAGQEGIREFTIPAQCVTSDEVVLVFMNQNEDASVGIHGFSVEQP